MSWPAVVFWILLAWGTFDRRPILIYLFFISAAFGTLAVVPVEYAAGVNLLPQPVVAAVLVVRVALHPVGRRFVFKALGDLRFLGLLTLVLIVSTVVTLFAPRIFSGTIDVVSLGGVEEGAQPLGSSMTNFTQLAYFSLSVVTAAVFAVVVSTGVGVVTVLKGLVYGGVAILLTGVLAMVADAAGMNEALQPFRTATYVLLTEAEVLNVRRVVGLMPEASTYGSVCVIYAAALALLHPCMTGSLRRVNFIAAPALIVFAALSTSSTAFIGIGATLLLIAGNWLRRLVTCLPHQRSSGVVEVFAGGLLAAFALWVLMSDFNLVMLARNMVDLLLFQKANSSSYYERMQWSALAYEAFKASSGIGIGLGTARTSNWFIAMLSSTGIVGMTLMTAFICQSLLRHAGPGPNGDFVWALKGTLTVSLLLAALVGTSADFGLGTAALYGGLAGLRLRRHPSGQEVAAPAVSHGFRQVRLD